METEETNKDISIDTGTMSYETSFKLNNEELNSDWQVDLGHVNYACTVYLNNIEICKKLWAPYVISLPNEHLVQNNTLRVEVSNTLSNLFTSKEYLDQVDKIYSPEGARYVKILENWERDTLSSGLLGPVKLRKRL